MTLINELAGPADGDATATLGAGPRTAAEFLQLVDHTLIRPDMRRAEVQRGLEVALELHTAGVVVRPWEARHAAEVVANSGVLLITYVGFPHGGEPIGVKVAQAEHAVADGADEIDVLMNIGAYRSGDVDYVREELTSVIAAIQPIPVKVLLESAYLHPAQVVEASRIAEECGAAFIKNGTGYSPRGAEATEIALIRATVGKSVGVKAAGGIRDLDTALGLIRAGANRLGTSSTVALMEEWRALGLC